ncbi:MAG: hypothetical protein ACKOJ7_04250 [Betaproteobacteria bacterium]
MAFTIKGPSTRHMMVTRRRSPGDIQPLQPAFSGEFGKAAVVALRHAGGAGYLQVSHSLAARGVAQGLKRVAVGGAQRHSRWGV